MQNGPALELTSATLSLQGAVGEEWVEEIDGSDPEMSPLGKPLGDGVSLSCKDSTVSHNVSPFRLSIGPADLY